MAKFNKNRGGRGRGGDRGGDRDKGGKGSDSKP